MFFDDFPAFFATSRTAAYPARLNLRHQAMIEANKDILAGARVLDLASHDGRWSFAALKAGAAHVIGVEARRELIDNACQVFDQYGVARDDYEFVQGDLFRVLRRREFEVDVVLCLGFVYHTLRYGELFQGIKNTQAGHCILDTKVYRQDEPVIKVLTNKVTSQGNAAKDQLTEGGLALAGYPSVSALALMLEVYGFEIEQQYDWDGLLAAQPRRLPAVSGYARGQRVTLRCARAPVTGAPTGTDLQGAVKTP